MMLQTLFDKDFYTMLTSDQTVQACDQFEWEDDAFTAISEGSEFIGLTVAELNAKVTKLDRSQGSSYRFFALGNDRRVFRKVA